MRIWQTIYNLLVWDTKTKVNWDNVLDYEESINKQKAEIADMLHAIDDKRLIKLLSERRDKWREKAEWLQLDLNEANRLLENIYKEFPEVVLTPLIKKVDIEMK